MRMNDIQLMGLAEKNRQVIGQFFEALNLQDTERIAQLVYQALIAPFTFQECPPWIGKEIHVTSAAVGI